MKLLLQCRFHCLTLMPKAIANSYLCKIFFILKIATYPTTVITFLAVREFFFNGGFHKIMEKYHF